MQVGGCSSACKWVGEVVGVSGSVRYGCHWKEV